MARKHECDCGHGKNQHSNSSITGETVYSYCRVDGCKCRMYIFKKFVIGSTVKLTDKIDKTRKSIKISDLGPNGKLKT